PRGRPRRRAPRPRASGRLPLRVADRRLRRSAVIAPPLLAAACLPAALLAACGGDDSSGAANKSGEAAKTVTIYSSFPLQGAGRAQSQAAVNGAKLALEQSSGKAGTMSGT